MKKWIALFALTIPLNIGFGQALNMERRVDWSNAGAEIMNYSLVFNVLEFGIKNDGLTDCSDSLLALINRVNKEEKVIFFPKGTYLFKKSISVPARTIIRGAGANSTSFLFDLNGIADHCFKVIGSQSSTSIPINSDLNKDSKIIPLSSSQSTSLSHILITENDAGRMTSDWAFGSLGQICRVINQTNSSLILEEGLRMHYKAVNNPKITQLFPVNSVGFDCFKISRLDATTAQTSNIFFRNAYQCWVQGVESYYCNFAHVVLEQSNHLTVRNSFFTLGFDYGGGGKAYGTAIQLTTGSCLITNNIFEKLRHSVLLQAAANGNVVSYNYSRDPFWTQILVPSNSSGDLTLHGNYIYQNLFEGNIVQNIVIDFSHGPNGPFNTFFRNRAELYGIFMSNGAGNSQNFIANEIPGTIGLYTLSGTDHYQYGNNKAGITIPAGSSQVEQTSLYLTKSVYCSNDFNPMFPSIGYPNRDNKGTNSAVYRYVQKQLSMCTSDCNSTQQKDSIASPAKICKDQMFQAQVNPNICSNYKWTIDPTTDEFEVLKNKVNIKSKIDGIFHLMIQIEREESECENKLEKTIRIENCTYTEEKRLNFPRLVMEHNNGELWFELNNEVLTVDIQINSTEGRCLVKRNARVFNASELATGYYWAGILWENKLIVYPFSVF